MNSDKNISKYAVIKNTSLESDDIHIESGAQLTNVHIRARKITIKSHASLTECKLFSDHEIKVGESTAIKERTIMNAFNGISIGDRTVIDRDVFVGGIQSERSRLEVGDDCVILYRSYLNTTRKISIKNNVGIGGYCLIFTHSAWQNVLEGNPFKFANVEIGDNVWLPWNATILPGVIIDNDVTVGAGAVVTKSLPAFVIAVGVPAKIIKTKKTGVLSENQKEKIILEILSDFQGYANDFLKLKNVVSRSPEEYILQFSETRLRYAKKFDKDFKSFDIVVSFKIPNEMKNKYEWIELDTLTACIKSEISRHFLTFIRRYGLKLKSISPSII